MKRLVSSFLAVSMCLSPALTRNTEAINIVELEQIWNDAKEIIKKFNKVKKVIKEVSQEEKEKIKKEMNCCISYLYSNPSKNWDDSDCCNAFSDDLDFVIEKIVGPYEDEKEDKSLALPTIQPRIEL